MKFPEIKVQSFVVQANLLHRLNHEDLKQEILSEMRASDKNPKVLSLHEVY